MKKTYGVNIMANIKDMKKMVVTFYTFSTAIDKGGYFSWSWQVDEDEWTRSFVETEIEEVIECFEHCQITRTTVIDSEIIDRQVKVV